MTRQFVILKLKNKNEENKFYEASFKVEKSDNQIIVKILYDNSKNIEYPLFIGRMETIDYVMVSWEFDPNYTGD